MARRRKWRGAVGGNGPSTAAFGGTWAPLPEADIRAIQGAALSILADIGVAEAPDIVCEAICALGGKRNGQRLLFPRDFVEETISASAREIILCGQERCHDLIVGGRHCHTGTGGAAPFVADIETGAFRRSRLADLHSAARLADALPHVHFFSRSVVSGDVADPLLFDLNTAFASLAGTSKHVMVQASAPQHVEPLAKLCHMIAGSEDAFRARPFLSLNVNHVVPPLRFHSSGVAVLAEAVKWGIPVHCNVFGQLGASSPVTIAGSAAQTLAETLAGLAFVHALDSSALSIAGPRAMITDLRTGGMAGGAGEQAVATAVCMQAMRDWGIPCTAIAGATDSKQPDAQAGFEKALTVVTAVQSGANMVTQAAGMQSGLMVFDFAGMVIDNDMLGAVLRANVPPAVNDETLALGQIAEVVRGEGHFLGRAETYDRMRSDFLYPAVADRRSLEEWEAAGRPDLAETARAHARSLLADHWPDHISQAVKECARDAFGVETGFRVP